MSDLAAERAALRSGGGAVALTRDTLDIEGPDAVTYLQGQLSQDVGPLAEGESSWTFALLPQGKVGAWFRLTRRGDDQFLADIDAGYGEALLAHLQRFLLRTRCDFTLATLPMVAVRGTDLVGAQDGVVQVDPQWPGVLGVDLIGEGAAIPDGLPPCGVEAYEIVRIEAGVPAMGAELTEKTIPAEAGVVERSVSFTKGCFTGQELVARIDSRGGNVPRHLRGLVVEGQAPVAIGAEIVIDDKAVALAYVGRAVEPPAGATVDGIPVRILSLPML